jgi:hypothetical protein
MLSKTHPLPLHQVPLHVCHPCLREVELCEGVICEVGLCGEDYCEVGPCVVDSYEDHCEEGFCGDLWSVC